MLEPCFAGNETLRNRLSNLVRTDECESAIAKSLSRVTATSASLPGSEPAVLWNVIVTADEIPNLNGTGSSVRRVCDGWPNLLSIHAGGYRGVRGSGSGQARLATSGRSRAEFFRNALRVLHNRRVDTVLCVPFQPDELLTSIAIHECFGAKLCAYLMDDQNVACQNIPDTLMKEFLQRCSLRLATHPELRAAYQQKYGLPFHVLPSTVPASLVATEPLPPPSAPPGSRKGALIGNSGYRSWYGRIWEVLSHCDCRVDWLGNEQRPWPVAPKGPSTAAAQGVVRELAQYPFVIFPVEPLDESNAGSATLGLPEDLLRAIATSHTPVLVVGSPETCAGRLVRHFGVGEVAGYDAAQISASIDRMRTPDAQQRMRQAAARIAAVLSDRDIPEWLAQSIRLGGPADPRFEELFAGYYTAHDQYHSGSTAL